MQKFLDSFGSDEDYVNSIYLYYDSYDHSPYFHVELSGSRGSSKKFFYNKVRTNYFNHKFDSTEKDVTFHLHFDGVLASLVSLSELMDLSWRCDDENVPYGLQVSLIEKLKLDSDLTKFEAWTLSEDEAEVLIISKTWSEIHNNILNEDSYFRRHRFLYFEDKLFYGAVNWSGMLPTEYSTADVNLA